MLEQLAAGFEKMLRFIKGEGKVTERSLDEALKMLRLALLEADVNYKVVKELEGRIRDKALGEEVLHSLTPWQQVIKIVRDELTAILGGEPQLLKFSSQPPSIFMVVGLQGSGKTTTCGKLARWTAERRKNPLLVSFDLKRPAAQEQIKVIGRMVGIPVDDVPANYLSDPAAGLKQICIQARNRGFDPLIVDTAGRLHIDDELMEELRLVKEILQPVEVIYVADAMTGQDAVNSAREFDQRVGLTSIVLTKLDGDARGGAALSVVAVTGKPVKFVGLGEKMDKFEPFYPDRMASRILGMGDVLTLIEKAEKEADEKEAEELARKLRKQEFDLEDFKKQLLQFRKMGSFQEILGHLPKTGPFKELQAFQFDEKKIKHFIAIINSMTPDERRNPRLLNGSRRLRIARGSGRPVQEVNQLVKSFAEIEKMLKKKKLPKILIPRSR